MWWRAATANDIHNRMESITQLRCCISGQWLWLTGRDGTLTVYMAGKQFVRVHRSSPWAINWTRPVKAPVYKNIYSGILQHRARTSAPCTKRESQASIITSRRSLQWNFCFRCLQAKWPVFRQNLVAFCTITTVYCSETFKDEITLRLWNKMYLIKINLKNENSNPITVLLYLQIDLTALVNVLC